MSTQNAAVADGGIKTSAGGEFGIFRKPEEPGLGMLEGIARYSVLCLSGGMGTVMGLHPFIAPDSPFRTDAAMLRWSSAHPGVLGSAMEWLVAHPQTLAALAIGTMVVGGVAGLAVGALSTHAVKVAVSSAWKAAASLFRSDDATEEQKERARALLDKVTEKFGASAEFDDKTGAWIVRSTGDGDARGMTEEEFAAFRREVAERGQTLATMRCNDDQVVVQTCVGGKLHNEHGPAVLTIGRDAAEGQYALSGKVLDENEWRRRTAPVREAAAETAPSH